VSFAHGRPPSGSFNSFRIIGPREITFLLTVLSPNSFSCNTCGFHCKCCKQKTYRKTNSFRCNTYKKQGGGIPVTVNQLFLRSNTFTSSPEPLQRLPSQSQGHPTHSDQVGVLLPIPSFFFQLSPVDRRSRPCRDCRPPPRLPVTSQLSAVTCW